MCLSDAYDRIFSLQVVTSLQEMEQVASPYMDGHFLMRVSNVGVAMVVFSPLFLACNIAEMDGSSLEICG